jgi:glutathione S-transferase
MITAHGGKFLVRGEDPTIADCIAVPLLRSFTCGFIDHIDPKCLDGNPVIVKYIKDFCTLEPIQVDTLVVFTEQRTGGRTALFAPAC